MSNEDKNFGPAEVAGVMGICVSSYIGHGVTRAEVLELVGALYDGISETCAGEIRCGCGAAQIITPERVPGDGVSFVEAIDKHGWECEDERWRCPAHATRKSQRTGEEN